MSTTTMHFGPEWMRAKQQPQARSQAPPSPPPASNSQSATSTYSALVSAIPATQNDKQDEAHPFRYSKEELLKIYKETPKGSLGLEVERWEGVVREIGSDPVGLREMGEAEKKLFAGPLNSDLRRRQSTDLLSPLIVSGTERTRLSHNSPSTTGSPLRERYTGLKRRDSNTDSPTPTLARKTSLSALQSPSISSRTSGLPSPRIRQGFNGGAFDGVLGETWTSRRRISEASRPGAISRDSSGGLNIDNGAKVGTVQGDGREVGDAGVNQGRGTPSQIEAPSTPDSSGRRQSSGVNTPNGSVGAPNAAGSGPADPKDLPAVEWTYKDPSGNIQGPFRADLMQKWYDDGYFESILPMKRVLYDAEWITVGEIQKRATLDKIFLSPLRPVGPPGLTKRDSPSLHQAGDVFNNPYQPAPIRSLRSSTLDTFNGSNPSDSPSSSLGHFGNNSPDPVAYPGLTGNGHGYVGGDGNAMLGFGGGMDVNGIRRSHFQDFHEPSRLHSPSYGNIMGNQGFMNNGHLYSGQFNTVQTSPWATPSHDAYTAYGNATYGAGAFAPNTPFNGQLPNQVIGGQINPLLYGGDDLNHLNASTQFSNHLAANNVGNEQHFGNTPQGYGVQQYQAPSTDTKDNQTDYALQQENQGAAPAAWDSAPSILPNAINTSVPASSSQSSPWGEPQEPSQATEQATIPKDASPWVLASQGVLESPWGQPQEPEGASLNTTLEKLDEEPVGHQELAVASEPSVATTAPSPSAEPSQAPAPKGKKSKSASSTSVSTPAPAPAPGPTPADSPTPSPATPATPAQKAPWAKDDKKKVKTAGAAISLREIQDAEAKAAEARKAKEEKERASRLAASASVESREDVQPFTASWGLPTSQAGGRTSSYAKDAPSAPAPAASTPVWTNAPKPVVKKTMKEIQEEEERRKKAAAKETIASAAAKRVYAESTAKSSPVAAPPSNSAWVTVGASGKTGSAPAPSRPPVAAVASSPQVRSNGPSAVRPAGQASASKPTVSPSAKVEDFPVSPSHEFLKWLTESLKGLNSSVNVEEIISMLLSFSLDPDPITIEIIQETIYANSTTLDGRRFAADFVAKRKADAASRRSGGAAGKAASKPVSIAEVVKATPKASQPEWGGFKVVNKKKKGGRA